MPSNKRPLIIGITGSIGSGKTTYCSVLESRYKVCYADNLAHQALQIPWIIGSLALRWGSGILKNGTVNRKLVSDIVFNDVTELAWLNFLLHPVILYLMQDNVENSQESTVVFEVPLLFEEKLEKHFDYIVLIVAEESLRITRLSDDRGIPPEESMARIKQQLPDNHKIALADEVISNNSSRQELEAAALDLLNRIAGLPQRETIPFSQVTETD